MLVFCHRWRKQYFCRGLETTLSCINCWAVWEFLFQDSDVGLLSALRNWIGKLYLATIFWKFRLERRQALVIDLLVPQQLLYREFCGSVVVEHRGLFTVNAWAALNLHSNPALFSFTTRTLEINGELLKYNFFLLSLRWLCALPVFPSRKSSSCYNPCVISCLLALWS